MYGWKPSLSESTGILLCSSVSFRKVRLPEPLVVQRDVPEVARAGSPAQNAGRPGRQRPPCSSRRAASAVSSTGISCARLRRPACSCGHGEVVFGEVAVQHRRRSAADCSEQAVACPLSVIRRKIGTSSAMSSAMTINDHHDISIRVKARGGRGAGGRRRISATPAGCAAFARSAARNRVSSRRSHRSKRSAARAPRFSAYSGRQAAAAARLAVLPHIRERAIDEGPALAPAPFC